MRDYPNMGDEYDLEEWKALNAEEWMMDCLKLNPSYNCWGPHEDYMWKDKNSGWDSPKICETWREFGPWGLDDFNEIVNFYFFIRRESKDCLSCDGGGYNPATKKIADNYYDYSSDTGKGWGKDLTDDEYEVLMKYRNLTREKAEQRVLHDPLGTDALDRWTLIEVRAKRMGVWGKCKECQGKGSIYTEPQGWLGLTLWVLHPRKGCSRGVEVKHIKRDELPEVYSLLSKAAERNADRFSKIIN